MSKRFIWFVFRSWGYMRGSRQEFFSGFWKAWKEFDRLSKED